jgi:Tol biopolymer transport system component
LTYSTDGLEVYFASNRHQAEGTGVMNLDLDIYVTRRERIDTPWSPAVNLGSAINTVYWEENPFLSADGLTLYFNARSPETYSVSDIWMTTRETKEGDWGPAVGMGSTVNSHFYSEVDPSLTSDGLELYFSSDRSGPRWHYTLWVTKRETVHDNWSTPVNLGSTVNGSYSNIASVISPDGLVLVLARDNPETGGFDLWMTKRPSREGDWGVPEKLPSAINIMNVNINPAFSPDGCWLLWASASAYVSPDGYDIWQAPIVPIVDFNGDGLVDTTDLLLMIENWGTDESLYDIGPMPWGDGAVDFEDLKVFMEYWEAENMP